MTRGFAGGVSIIMSFIFSLLEVSQEKCSNAFIIWHLISIYLKLGKSGHTYTFKLLMNMCKSIRSLVHFKKDCIIAGYISLLKEACLKIEITLEPVTLFHNLIWIRQFFSKLVQVERKLLRSFKTCFAFLFCKLP